MPIKNLARVCELWPSPQVLAHNGYGEANQALKDKAHKIALSTLRAFAKEYLHLQPAQFEVRSNQGGVAVCGEVMLYTDHLPDKTEGIMVEFCQSFDTIMYRAIKHRKDYTGGPNQWTSVRIAFKDDLAVREFATTIRRLLH